jgi:hypothetical protein
MLEGGLVHDRVENALHPGAAIEFGWSEVRQDF